MFSLEMYARTQYTHNPLHSGMQPALCVLVHAGWIQGFRALDLACREVSQGRAVRGGCASCTEDLMPQLEGLSPVPGHTAHVSDSSSDSSFLTQGQHGLCVTYALDTCFEG